MNNARLMNEEKVTKIITTGGSTMKRVYGSPEIFEGAHGGKRVNEPVKGEKAAKQIAQGGGTMKRLLGSLAVFLLVAGAGYGYSTTDTVTLTVLPLINLSVNISSATGDFGGVNLGSSKSICIGDIINDGNVDAQWDKAGSNSTNWSLWDTATRERISSACW